MTNTLPTLLSPLKDSQAGPSLIAGGTTKKALSASIKKALSVSTKRSAKGGRKAVLTGHDSAVDQDVVEDGAADLGEAPRRQKGKRIENLNAAGLNANNGEAGEATGTCENVRAFSQALVSAMGPDGQTAVAISDTDEAASPSAPATEAPGTGRAVRRPSVTSKVQMSFSTASQRVALSRPETSSTEATALSAPPGESQGKPATPLLPNHGVTLMDVDHRVAYALAEKAPSAASDPSPTHGPAKASGTPPMAPPAKAQVTAVEHVAAPVTAVRSSPARTAVPLNVAEKTSEDTPLDVSSSPASASKSGPQAAANPAATDTPRTETRLAKGASDALTHRSRPAVAQAELRSPDATVPAGKPTRATDSPWIDNARQVIKDAKVVPGSRRTPSVLSEAADRSRAETARPVTRTESPLHSKAESGPAPKPTDGGQGKPDVAASKPQHGETRVPGVSSSVERETRAPGLAVARGTGQRTPDTERAAGQQNVATGPTPAGDATRPSASVRGAGSAVVTGKVAERADTSAAAGADQVPADAPRDGRIVSSFAKAAEGKATSARPGGDVATGNEDASRPRDGAGRPTSVETGATQAQTVPSWSVETGATQAQTVPSWSVETGAAQAQTVPSSSVETGAAQAQTAPSSLREVKAEAASQQTGRDSKATEPANVQTSARSGSPTAAARAGNGPSRAPSSDVPTDETGKNVMPRPAGETAGSIKADEPVLDHDARRAADDVQPAVTLQASQPRSGRARHEGASSSKADRSSLTHASRSAARTRSPQVNATTASAQSRPAGAEPGESIEGGRVALSPETAPQAPAADATQAAPESGETAAALQATRAVASASADAAGRSAADEPSRQVGARMIETGRSYQAGGEGRVELRLNPPELGKVVIRFQRRRGVVEGVIEVEKTETRRELQEAVSSMQRDLVEAGLTVRRIQIVAMNENSGGAESQAHNGAHFGSREALDRQSDSSEGRAPETQEAHETADGAVEDDEAPVEEGALNLLV